MRVGNVFDYIGWLLTISTVAGNGFVIVLVIVIRRLHSSANWFVLSLAVADFLVGFAIFPPAFFCDESCNRRLVSAFFWFSLNSSVSNLCILTWDRFFAIVRPLKYHSSLTMRHTRLIVMTAWLIAFALSLSNFVGYYVTDSHTALLILFLISIPVFQILSCTFLLYAIIRILVAAREQTRREAALHLELTHSNQADQSVTAATDAAPRRRHKKPNSAPFIIALVLLSLGCCVTANGLILCINFSCNIPELGGHVLTTLWILNSAFNPFVYACLKKDIKRELTKLIRRRK